MDDTLEFVSAAFPNCVISGLAIEFPANRRVMDAIGKVAHSIVITGALYFDHPVTKYNEIVEFAGKFRRVKVSNDSLSELIATLKLG